MGNLFPHWLVSAHVFLDTGSMVDLQTYFLYDIHTRTAHMDTKIKITDVPKNYMIQTQKGSNECLF